MTYNEQKAKLEIAKSMDDFLAGTDIDFGRIPENLSVRMADAAFNVLMANKELYNYLQNEGEIK